MALAIGVAVGGVLPPSGARLTGGITWCQALTDRPIPGETRYVQGLVQLLKGDVSWQPDPSNPGVLQDVLPTEVVAQETVGTDDRYSFEFSPGHYVLYAPQSAGVSNAFRYVEVTLKRGDNVIVDIPNNCI
jgi:hypothetical protein